LHHIAIYNTNVIIFRWQNYNQNVFSY